MITILTPQKTAIFIKVLKMAEALEQKLQWTSGIRNGMDRIVEFFQTTSPYQDEFLRLLQKQTEGIHFKDQKKQKFFESFRKFLENAGRCECGWNRTKIGETPSASSTYINLKVPYDELFFTRNVTDHLSRRNNPKGEVDHALKEEAYGKWNETGLIEKEFVNPFIQNNYNHLIQILKEYRN